jgi:hypothetical protein
MLKAKSFFGKKGDAETGHFPSYRLTGLSANQHFFTLNFQL